ncbi:AmmeMemoRadiSam system protein B [Ramlibacter albus]|uniref:MEMO1 family protein H8R02_23130 n=1 Tax=Ramlibacter albus TaxID=2079448 RepID=A0A923S4Y8_9BURK|nr:AmmeMemoRadiSam system protein B [Ramlibacter albus]MBC5767378.1 AmmeMemoRadiSam system protein B [Ramlibacter albus]
MEASTQVRPQAVAGMFYPGERGALVRTVQAMLDEAPAAAAANGWPKALIVPHAGYVYSGSTAAAAFAQLAPGRGTIRRVVLLGPVHRVPVRGLALPGATAFETPLGNVPLDVEGMRAVSQLPQVVMSPRAHAHEHSLEVQLPFLQQVLGDFALLPFAVGDATREEVAQVLEQVWGGPETVIVISSDLSHYHPYDMAKAIDTDTVSRMLRGETTINHEQACGATPVNGLLLAAPRHGLQSRLVAQCNSGDTAGDRGRVVGYASLAFDEKPSSVGADLPEDAGKTLLLLARAAIRTALGKPHVVIARGPWLREPGATFVTLKQQGNLRGCIGALQAHRPLIDDVKHNAVAAALHDTRFSPVTAEELDSISVEVSLLSPPEPVHVRSEEDALQQLRPGIDGVILHRGARRATFLPQVWEQLAHPRQFLAHLKQKAGLPATYWDDGMRIERYTVRKWSEDE